MGKLVDRTELTQGALADILPVIDVSDTTDSAEGTSKYATLASLFKGFLKFVPGYAGYIIIPGSGNTDMTIVQQNDILIGKGAYQGGNAVILVATQDSPVLDSHFAKFLNNSQL